MGDEREHVQVPTYVPASQRDAWREEADDLDMSQAEYVRTMVQAGRRSFDLDRSAGSEGSGTGNAVEPGSRDATPGVEGLKARVLEILRSEEFADWDELLAGATNDVEERLENALEELQSEDRVKYSGRHGGYAVVDDGR